MVTVIITVSSFTYYIIYMKYELYQWGATKSLIISLIAGVGKVYPHFFIMSDGTNNKKGE